MPSRPEQDGHRVSPDLKVIQKENQTMSKRDKKKGCQKPENLKAKPEKCTRKQIRKCHGNVAKHPCTSKKQG